MAWTITIVLLCLTLLLILLVMNRNRTTQRPRRITRPVAETGTKKEKLPCILCGSPLEKGENLKSEEFKGEKESAVHIYGCPNCYGNASTKIRTCPICKETLHPGEYLMGRMWRTKKGKLHLHVSGCISCAGRKPGS